MGGKAKDRRENIWKPYLKENKDRLINWALKRGIVNHIPTDPDALDFLVAEVFSRVEQVKALKEKFGKGVLFRQMPLKYHYDMEVIVSGSTQAYEGKFRCYDSTLPTSDITKKKTDYDECKNCPYPVYFINVSYDDKVRCWDMFDENVTASTWTHSEKTAVDGKEITEECLKYPNDKPLWEFTVSNLNPLMNEYKTTTTYDKQSNS